MVNNCIAFPVTYLELHDFFNHSSSLWLFQSLLLFVFHHTVQINFPNNTSTTTLQLTLSIRLSKRRNLLKTMYSLGHCPYPPKTWISFFYKRQERRYKGKGKGLRQYWMRGTRPKYLAPKKLLRHLHLPRNRPKILLVQNTKQFG